MIERRKQTPVVHDEHDEKVIHNHPNNGSSPSKSSKAFNSNATTPTEEPLQPNQRNACKARSFLFAVASIYSTNCASLKFLETGCQGPDCTASPAATTFTRFLLSIGLCIPILWAFPTTRSLYFAGFECGCLMMVNYICQAVSLQYIPASKCTFIGALSVITTPLYNTMLRHKPIAKTHWISVIISILGVGILEQVIPIVGQTSTKPSAIGMGDWLALGQPLAFGYAVMRIEDHLDRHRHIPQRVLLLTSVQCITVCFWSGVWVLFSGATVSFASYGTMPRMIGIVWLGIVTTVVAIVLQGKAFQAGASSTEAALFYSSEPVFGALFAQWLLGERLNRNTYVGGGCILLACLLGSLPNQRLPKQRPRMKSKQSGVWLEEECFETELVSSGKIDKV